MHSLPEFEIEKHYNQQQAEDILIRAFHRSHYTFRQQFIGETLREFNQPEVINAKYSGHLILKVYHQILKDYHERCIEQLRQEVRSN